jgi:hypothetical protein
MLEPEGKDTLVYNDLIAQFYLEVQEETGYQ